MTDQDGQTYATGKPLPPETEWVPRIFRRESFFYVLDLPADDDLQFHADMNPGTLRIEDLEGKQLWPYPPKLVETPPSDGEG